MLQNVVERLRVVEVPPCGWTDLGTSERVDGCVRRLRAAPSARQQRGPGPYVVVDLAAASLQRFGVSRGGA